MFFKHYPILTIVLLLLAFLIGHYFYLLSDPRFTEEDLDFNGDGYVSWFEATHVSGVIEEELVIDGKECMQYSLAKDGVPFKLVCKEKSL